MNLASGITLRRVTFPRIRDIEGVAMKRKAHALVLLSALGGCMSTAPTVDPSTQAHNGVAGTVRAVPNAVGPWGDPVAARAGDRPTPDMYRGNIRQAVATSGDNDSGIQQTNGFGGKNGASPMPSSVAGAVAATGALVGPQYNPYGNGRTSIRFGGPAGMKIAWFNGQGPGGFTPTMVEAPGRYNFPQAAAYRLKLTDFPNRAGLELYPTLEVIPASSKTATFLAHSAVPINISEEDLEQVSAGNFVVKVIYLPDPAYQDLTAAGPDEVVSSRLEPGVNPVAEAQRRGSVLAILRIGNIDLEAPNTPAMDAPPGGMMGPMGPMMRPGMMPPNMMNPPAGGPGGPVAPAPPTTNPPAVKTAGGMTASADAAWYRMK
jgi:hypothetical protein